MGISFHDWTLQGPEETYFNPLVISSLLVSFNPFLQEIRWHIFSLSDGVNKDIWVIIEPWETRAQGPLGHQRREVRRCWELSHAEVPLLSPLEDRADHTSCLPTALYTGAALPEVLIWQNDLAYTWAIVGRNEEDCAGWDALILRGRGGWYVVLRHIT